jgi:hypothetical protein|tara:strand:+ start:33679 stop:34110 length:432 start_codon:yes stop_codon:yes gene_type:complete
MSQFDFSDQEVEKGSTSEYTIYELADEPVLVVTPAAETNRPYYQTMLRRMGKQQGRKISAAIVRENRDDDRELYAKYIVVGWRGVMNKAQKEVPFSRENCADFLKALPNHIFDGLRTHCGELLNFLEDEEGIDPDELEASAGN